MEIKIDLDLPSIISAAVTAERVQPIIDEAISSAIKDVIYDATGYRSEFRKALKKQLSEALPKGLGLDDCAKFQHVLNSELTKVVHSENSVTIQTALKRVASEVMPDVPLSIKISQLIKLARESFRKKEHEAFYARLEMSDYGGGWLYLDDDENTRDKYRSDIRISFSEDGSVYALRFDGYDVTPKKFPNAVGNFDGLLLSMYVGRTSLEIDCDESEVESLAAEQYD